MSLKRRIQHDARRVAGDREAAALHACLVENLFEAALDATFLGKICGAGRELRDRLAAVVGPLKGYILELRMIKGAQLVRETDLTNAQIAERLGFPAVRTFYRRFKECHGLTPGEMRKQARAAAALDRPAAAGAPAATGAREPAGGRRTWDGPERLTPRARAARLGRRARIALHDAGAGDRLRSRLRRRHPVIEEAAGSPDRRSPAEPRYPLILMPTGDRLEQFAAGAVFDRILALPETDLRHAMLDGVRIGTSTAFEVLLGLCYGHTRWNPEGAVAVAELGVQLLELHREAMADKADDWKALAWAGLGRILLRDALERYLLVRTPILEVAAEAELAALCALRGQAEESRRLAASAAEFLDALPGHRRAWTAAGLLRALAKGVAGAPAEELSAILAALCENLDSVRWEITGAQAAPAAAARRAGA